MQPLLDWKHFCVSPVLAAVSPVGGCGFVYVVHRLQREEAAGLPEASYSVASQSPRTVSLVCVPLRMWSLDKETGADLTACCLFDTILEMNARL